MASRLITRRPGFLVGAAGLSGLMIAPVSPFSTLRSLRKPLYCEGPGPSRKDSTPLFKSGVGSKGGLNPVAVRQISTGSVLGLVSGLAISTFSKPLTIIIGVLILGVQLIESRLGIAIVPKERIQRWITNVNVRRMIEGNMPFKVSYGAALLLAGWGSFSAI